MRIVKWLACSGIVAISSCELIPILEETALTPQVEVSTLPPCIDDDCNCGDFRDQTLAQAVLEAFPDDPFVLDQDGNGWACESLPPVSSGLDPIVSSPRSMHLALGNPSNANFDNLNNYLITRSQYALSYNRDRGIANWVSWQLSADWLGNTERQDNFRQDGSLPTGSYQVTPNDYRNTGYDRGHIVPSGDRTSSVQDNSATFLMTNVQPQAPANNQGIWRELEEYSRDQVYQFDKQLYIIAGGYGQQTYLANGRVTVPSRLWKIIVILDPRKSIENIDLGTPIVVVDMPNRDTQSPDWRTYQTTIDRLELATGYDFLSQVPGDIQEIIESAPYDAP